MSDDLLIVSSAAPAQMERELLDALGPALKDAVWAAVQPVVQAIVSAHVRELVEGAQVLPQPQQFRRPPIPAVELPTLHPVVADRPSNAAEAPIAEVEPGASEGQPEPSDSEAAGGGQTKKYRMGKGSKDSYGDIALAEISEDEFDLYDSWDRLAPLIDVDSERAAENYRRAIRNDTRFEVSVDMRRARKMPQRNAPQPI